MAQVFLIKEGRPHVATSPQRVAIESLTEKLTPFEKRYFDAPPDINPARGRSSEDDEFRHVVVKIDEAEINAVFPDAGYYHIPQLTPEDCRQLLGIKSLPRH